MTVEPDKSLMKTSFLLYNYAQIRQKNDENCQQANFIQTSIRERQIPKNSVQNTKCLDDQKNNQASDQLNFFWLYDNSTALCSAKSREPGRQTQLKGS